MVSSHNRLIDGKQGSPSSTALCAATFSNRHQVADEQTSWGNTPADPAFDPHPQISRKFLWLGPRPAHFSHRYGMTFVRTRCSGRTQVAKCQLMQEDRTDRRARMRPPICSQSSVTQTCHSRSGAVASAKLTTRCQVHPRSFCHLPLAYPIGGAVQHDVAARVARLL
jgi:hypothetical protein